MSEPKNDQTIRYPRYYEVLRGFELTTVCHMHLRKMDVVMNTIASADCCEDCEADQAFDNEQL